MVSELIEELNEPAFPTAGKAFEFPGMTLRDWFAGQALAILGDPSVDAGYEAVAACVYKFADAMLKERAKLLINQ